MATVTITYTNGKVETITTTNAAEIRRLEEKFKQPNVVSTSVKE